MLMMSFLCYSVAGGEVYCRIFLGVWIPEIVAENTTAAKYHCDACDFGYG